MRPALAFFIFVATTSVAAAQGYATDGKTSFTKDSQIRIPFSVSSSSATSVKLYYSYDGGSWQEYDSVRSGGRREFIFKATDKEGAYSFATMTYFSDGRTDPPSRDRLMEQVRVVIDRTPPRVNSIRSVISPDGAPGLEWDINDENLETNSISLEFKWPEMARFEPIDKGTRFSARDHRYWQMRNNDRMEVRVIARDKAGNRTVSDSVFVSLKDGEKGGGPVEPRAPRTPAEGTSNPRDDGSTSNSRTVQPPVYYVKSKTITANYNANVGPSGLKAAYLWAADDRLEWKVAQEQGPKPAPETNVADKPRMIPLTFSYTAPKDGLYNFVIIVANHRDVSRRDPKKGELGEFQVIVDTTPPLVEVQAAKVSQNTGGGAIVDIRWKATDANMAVEPVMLEYQAKGRGEWTAMTQTWLDNTGQYTWTPPTGEAYEFNIRIRCKDRAGNEGMSQFKDTINTDLAKPGGDIIDVKPGVSDVRIGGGNDGGDLRIGPGPTPPPVKLPKM